MAKENRVPRKTYTKDDVITLLQIMGNGGAVTFHGETYVCDTAQSRPKPKNRRSEKERAFCCALLDAFDCMLQLEREFPSVLPRRAFVESRALFAWTKIDVSNMDLVARALVLIPGLHQKLMSGFDYSKVPDAALPTARELRTKLDGAIVSALERLASLVDEHATADMLAIIDR